MTTWGSRSTESPTTSVSGTAEAAARIRSTRSRAAAASASREVAVCCQASAAASARGTQGVTSVRPCSTSGRAPGQCQRVPSRTTRTPSGGPPHDRASPTRTSHATGVASRPRDAVASTTRGMPLGSVSAHASSSGCRVPTSPLAAWRAAATVPGTERASAQAPRSTAPLGVTRTSAKRSAAPERAARARPGTRIAECSTAEATVRAPRRSAAYSTPSTARTSAVGPLGRKLTSAGLTPRPSARTSRARASRAAARRPSAWRRAGSAQPASRAALSVSRATGCSGPDAASSRRRRTGALGDWFATPQRYPDPRGHLEPCGGRVRH